MYFLFWLLDLFVVLEMKLADDIGRCLFQSRGESVEGHQGKTENSRDGACEEGYHGREDFEGKVSGYDSTTPQEA